MEADSFRQLPQMALPKQLRCLCLILLFTGTVALGAGPKGLTVTKVIRSKVDVGMTIKGRWGTFINGKSYQRSALDTYKGWQYTTYYDQEKRLSIARRKLPDGAWDVIHFDDYTFKSQDNHNVTVIGICSNDGTIHLAFDHHNDPLNYRVSKPGAANNPDKIEWNASLFSEVRDWLQKGKPIRPVTYPQFVPTPQGNLLFFSRHGVPTDGRVTLCTYDPTKGGWSERRNITSSKGTYRFEGKTSRGRYSYPNGIHYDYETGRLHISWGWREGLRGVASRVDVNYAYSDDNGKTWFNSAGKKIGAPDQPITVNSPGIAVWDVDPHQGLDGQQGQCVDALGRPHVIAWHLRNGEEPLPIGKRDADKSAYYDYWREDKGEWHQTEVFHPVGSGADGERNRAKLVSTPDSDLIAMFNNKARIVLMTATAKKQYSDWRVLHIEEGPWDGEVLPDLGRWRDEGVLSIYMQMEPANRHDPTDLCVVDFHLTGKGTDRKNER